jgi:hypothetical protein
VRKVKASLVVLVGMQTALWCQAAGLKDTLEEMGVSLALPQSIEMIPPVDQNDVEYQVAFRFTDASYEVRISLFPESYLLRQSGYGDVGRYVPLFSMGLLAAIARDNLYFCKTADLPGPTVSKEFGADHGMTALVKGNKSDFGKGYAYIAIAFLYKAGKGAVVVSFLYNDPRDLNMDGLDFSQAYYCFRFNGSSSDQRHSQAAHDSPYE